MTIAIGVLAIIGVAALLIAGVGAFIVITGREYDKHPLFRRFMDANASMVPGYQPDDMTPEYRAQVPGGWDKL